MKKLTLLTAAALIAACSSANAANPPSLGDRIRMNWDSRSDRNMWADPMKTSADTNTSMTNTDHNNVGSTADTNMAKGKHHRHMTKEERMAKKAEWDKMTPEEKAAKKADMKSMHHDKMMKMTPEERAKMKAERKAKWDAMTPEQKAAWKAKHSAKKAMTTTTPTR